MESFENGDSSYSCGRVKTEAFKYDDVMPRFRLALSHIRFENAACGRRFFLNAEKKTPFSKIPGYVWTVKYDSKMLRVDAGYF